MESLGVWGGGLGVNFTEVCTLTPEFWDIPWVQSSGKYGSTVEVAYWLCSPHLWQGGLGFESQLTILVCFPRQPPIWD
jgi:hypothetical protein